MMFGLCVWALPGLSTRAFGQGGAIAFVPIPAPAINGETMTVTPAVSPDRRYVRLSVNAYFSVVNGFSSFTTPLGAVSGGGGGVGGGLGGGGGGIGGIGGIGGGGGAGVGGVGGLNGGTLDAGMGGVIGSAGFDGCDPFTSMMLADSLYTPADQIVVVDPTLLGPESITPRERRLVERRRSIPRSVPATAISPRDAIESNAAGLSTSTANSGLKQDHARAADGQEQTDGAERSRTRSSASRRERARQARAARVAESNDVEPIVKPKRPDGN
jgi:hypothetical protein